MTDSLSLSISLLSRHPQPSTTCYTDPLLLTTPLPSQRVAIPLRPATDSCSTTKDDKPFGGKNCSSSGVLLRTNSNEDPRFSPANRMETFLPPAAAASGPKRDPTATVAECETSADIVDGEHCERGSPGADASAAATAFVRVAPGTTAARAAAGRSDTVTAATTSTKPKIAPKPNLGPHHPILGSRVLPPLATNTRYVLYTVQCTGHNKYLVFSLAYDKIYQESLTFKSPTRVLHLVFPVVPFFAF